MMENTPTAVNNHDDKLVTMMNDGEYFNRASDFSAEIILQFLQKQRYCTTQQS